MTSDENSSACPSGRCRPGAVLVGIVGEDGLLGYIGQPMTIDADFVARARRGRTPESRFRFAEPCAEGRCGHWANDRCGLIDAFVESGPESLEADEPSEPLPRCSIRRSCRWFEQRGRDACMICPLVVHTPRTPAVLLTTSTRVDSNEIAR